MIFYSSAPGKNFVRSILLLLRSPSQLQATVRSIDGRMHLCRFAFAAGAGGQAPASNSTVACDREIRESPTSKIGLELLEVGSWPQITRTDCALTDAGSACNRLPLTLHFYPIITRVRTELLPSFFVHLQQNLSL